MGIRNLGFGIVMVSWNIYTTYNNILDDIDRSHGGMEYGV